MTTGPHEPPPAGVPGRPPARPGRAGRYWTGIGLAMFAHVITLGIPVLVLMSGAEDPVSWIKFALVGQGLVAIGSLWLGIALLRKPDGEVGAGILIGWAIGVLILPAIGFGTCVVLLSQGGI